jgi:acetyl/propionyl-CoA carboxylase alpha subunit
VRYFVKVAGETVELNVEHGAGGIFRVRGPGGRVLEISALARGVQTHTLSIAGQVVEVQLGEGEVKFAQERFSVEAESERERAATRSELGDARGSKEIVAPMPGRIVRVSCVPGAVVSKGASLVVIEAMKMQNELCAKADSVVRTVRVASGDTVDRGAVLVEFE